MNTLAATWALLLGEETRQPLNLYLATVSADMALQQQMSTEDVGKLLQWASHNISIGTMEDILALGGSGLKMLAQLYSAYGLQPQTEIETHAVAMLIAVREILTIEPARTSEQTQELVY